MEEELKKCESRFDMTLKVALFDVIVAHIDLDLRYTWVYNLHPEFGGEVLLGKRDDEIEVSSGTTQLLELKRRVIKNEMKEEKTITFPLKEGSVTFKISAEPLYHLNKLIGATHCSRRNKRPS